MLLWEDKIFPSNAEIDALIYFLTVRSSRIVLKINVDFSQFIALFFIISPLYTLTTWYFFIVLDRNELEDDLKMAERQMQAMALVVHQMICDGELFNSKKLSKITVIVRVTLKINGSISFNEWKKYVKIPTAVCIYSQGRLNHMGGWGGGQIPLECIRFLARKIP